MPIYEYRCPANGRTIEVSHAMSETVRTWGELCELAANAPGGTPADSPVEKVVSLVAAGKGKSEPPAGPCGSGCGCFPN